MDLLLRDLCMYYSYGEFLMDKFMELFQLNEVYAFLFTNLVSVLGAFIRLYVRRQNMGRKKC